MTMKDFLADRAEERRETDDRRRGAAPPGSVVALNVRFTREQHRALDALAFSLGQPKQRVILDALRPILERGRELVERGRYRGEGGPPD